MSSIVSRLLRGTKKQMATFADPFHCHSHLLHYFSIN